MTMMSSGTVLIVDDEPDVVRYLSAVLESHGYTVCSADNVSAAHAAIARQRPSLICLDIMMPEESGLSLLVKLRRQADTRDIPVIVISGMASEAEFDVRNFVEDRAVAPPEQYIEKPIDVDSFMTAVMRLTDKRSGRGKGQRKEGRV
jgi:CheY-like chemotaxis protein